MATMRHREAFSVSLNPTTNILAALKCRADRDGDEYVINGSKIWTSEGHIADRMFGLFRTDSSGRKQFGITFLMLDMDAPGVEVQPIWTYDGAGREINQVFFSDVRVPVSNRVGEENQGWGIAKYLLSLERFGTAEVSRSLRTLEKIKAVPDLSRDVFEVVDTSLSN